MHISTAKEEDIEKEKSYLVGYPRMEKPVFLIFMYFFGKNNKWHLLNIYCGPAVTYLNVPTWEVNLVNILIL